MDDPRALTAGPPGEESSTPELRKPHEMIVLMPRSKRVTLTGRLLYNAMLQVAQSRLAALQTMPSADYLFEAPLPALLRTTGSSGEDRTAAKRYLREMRGLEVDWESTAPGDGVKWRGFSMLSEVAIELRGGENWVAWSYPPTLMAALREPARWARIDLDMLARLGTYSAVALFEICARYRDNPSGVTSRKPVSWWVDALSPQPGGSERREWRKFKSERVKEAVDEINAHTDLEVELIEHRQGRAVMEVQFAVRRKLRGVRGAVQAALGAGQGQGNGTTVPADAHLVLRAESLGIRELKLEGLLKEFGADAVREQLDVVERRHASAHLRQIENPYSYLRSLLRQQAGQLDSVATVQVPMQERDAGPAWLAGDRLSGSVTSSSARVARRAGSVPTRSAASGAQTAGELSQTLLQGMEREARSPVDPRGTGAQRPAERRMPAAESPVQARPVMRRPGPVGTSGVGSDARSGLGGVVGRSAGSGTAPGVSSMSDSSWLERRIQQLKSELASMTPEQRQVWVELALKDLAERRLLSAVISRRAAQGDVLHGMLGAVLVKLYGERQYGTGWDSQT
ncbi:replication initiation protein [Ideonella livida]|uniref:Replication initiation protein n=1 Tax=Ideonella livida TaxID=2707176 RepID=A0A7C9TJ09_9BURK|nr:replication initiation protein [Ideonella livida]NDY90265.1 replication initiation protein [Ideonella livida]